MTETATATTRAVIDRLYDAYRAGDLEGMLALMADDVVVTFTGHGTFHGKAEARPYMEWAGTQLPELTFNVRHIIAAGEYAAVTWDEIGRTRHGEVWSAIGVDVHRVADGKIVELTVYTDTEKLARLLDPWPGASHT